MPYPIVFFFYRIAYYLVRIAFFFYYRISFEGRENVPKGTAVIFASNHRSYLDPVLVAMAAPHPFNFIAKEPLFRNPVFGGFIRLMGAFPTADAKHPDYDMLSEATKRLEKRRHLTIFPEGTRHTDGKVGRGKSGVCVLAARRGKHRTLRIGITKVEREQYRELLKTLDLGLEDRLTARVGLLSGGQRQALTLLMATMNKPKLLLLDEHTAALDPKTALKVLTLSAKIVEENHLTTMMITHNMKDAIKYGNRLIMMYEGHIIYDVSGEEKKNLHVSDLLAKFQIASGGEFANDRMILSN